jgi:hypothetical protein
MPFYDYDKSSYHKLRVYSSKRDAIATKANVGCWIRRIMPVTGTVWPPLTREPSQKYEIRHMIKLMVLVLRHKRLSLNRRELLSK